MKMTADYKYSDNRGDAIQRLDTCKKLGKKQ